MIDHDSDPPAEGPTLRQRARVPRDPGPERGRNRTEIERDGWVLARTRGSHHQYKHLAKPGLVTLPGKPGDDLAPGTLNSIFKPAGIKP